eukprot:UN18897
MVINTSIWSYSQHVHYPSFSTSAEQPNPKNLIGDCILSILKTQDFVAKFGRQSLKSITKAPPLSPQDIMLKSILHKSKSIERKRKLDDAFSSQYNTVGELRIAVRNNRRHILTLT